MIKDPAMRFLSRGNRLRDMGGDGGVHEVLLSSAAFDAETRGLSPALATLGLLVAQLNQSSFPQSSVLSGTSRACSRLGRRVTTTTGGLGDRTLGVGVTVVRPDSWSVVCCELRFLTSRSMWRCSHVRAG